MEPKACLIAASSRVVSVSIVLFCFGFWLYLFGVNPTDLTKLAIAHRDVETIADHHGVALGHSTPCILHTLKERREAGKVDAIADPIHPQRSVVVVVVHQTPRTRKLGCITVVVGGVINTNVGDVDVPTSKEGLTEVLHVLVRSVGIVDTSKGDEEDLDDSVMGPFQFGHDPVARRHRCARNNVFHFIHARSLGGRNIVFRFCF
jgi:hypothetical protein